MLAEVVFLEVLSFHRKRRCFIPSYLFVDFVKHRKTHVMFRNASLKCSISNQYIGFHASRIESNFQCDQVWWFRKVIPLVRFSKFWFTMFCVFKIRENEILIFVTREILKWSSWFRDKTTHCCPPPTPLSEPPRLKQYAWRNYRKVYRLKYNSYNTNRKSKKLFSRTNVLSYRNPNMSVKITKKLLAFWQLSL